MLAPNIRSNWEHLERVLMESFLSPLVRGWGPAAKRISIRNWEDGVKASDLKLPRSEADWLAAGRQRKAELGTTVSWSLAWYLVEPGEQLPPHAIQTGSEAGGPLVSIRVWKDGGLTLGKTGRHHPQGYVPWYGREISWTGAYEVLVGDQNAVRWASPSDGNFIAVEGGYETASTAALLIAQSQMGDTVQPGKAFSGEEGAYIGWWWNEHWKLNDEVRILAWAI
ncbi:hypothetical protein FRB90_006714 [Tulasnella sp. 427]|nr:hypothetical protein FRB90_006714 [Tulasnella sp. 427]